MNDFRFTKPERLLQRSDFLKAGREARQRVETKNFLVLLRPNGLSHTRLGVTVTKKIGKAVTRNRIKRHVREFYRHNKSLLPPGYDMVVIARQGAAELGTAAIREQLRTVLGRPEF